MNLVFVLKTIKLVTSLLPFLSFSQFSIVTLVVKHCTCLPFRSIGTTMQLQVIHFPRDIETETKWPFPDDIFKCIFFNENISISIKISLKFLTFNNIPALFQIMALCRSGDKPLSEPMMVYLLTHIYITRPQWVNAPFSILMNRKSFKPNRSTNLPINRPTCLQNLTGNHDTIHVTLGTSLRHPPFCPSIWMRLNSDPLSWTINPWTAQFMKGI